MAISTYSELQTAILSWLARTTDDEDEVTERVTDFITLAEARFNLELRVRQQQERIAATIKEPVAMMAARFLAPISASVQVNGKYFPLEYLTLDALTQYRNLTSDPRFYTISGGEILFGPQIPFDDSADPATLPKIELFGYFSQVALSDSNTVNDILKYYPNIYLYASLIEASAFITLDQITTWINFYDDAIAKANDTAGEAFEHVTAQPTSGATIV